MFPWLAHGHIFPYLELAKALLQRKNLLIYFCSTPINFESINTFIHKNSLTDSVQLVQLHLEPSPELPPHFHTTKNHPPSLNFTILKAFQTSSSAFAELVASLATDLLIYDVFQPWSAKIAAAKGIPSVHFSTFGAVPQSFVHHQYTLGEAEFPFPAIRFEEYELRSLKIAFAFLYGNIFDVGQDFLFGNFKESSHIVLVRASRGVEGKYIDYLSDLSEKTIVPVGPLIGYNSSYGEDSDVIRWLSEKEQYSTLFISFGSEYFLSQNEIEEIAKGFRCKLCMDHKVSSGKKDGYGGRISAGRVRWGERGVVVTGWAPQADVLAHPSTGGFVSHCGWSSIVESMYFGVPVIAMPMKLDQPMNARMLVEAGSCVEVRRDE